MLVGHLGLTLPGAPTLGHRVTLRNRGGATLPVGSDHPILAAFEAAGHVLPVGCRYGGCITCAARLIAGRVRQPGATALSRRQSELGYVLLCVARPLEDCVLDVGVESHGELYRNPFADPAAADLLKALVSSVPG